MIQNPKGTKGSAVKIASHFSPANTPLSWSPPSRQPLELVAYVFFPDSLNISKTIREISYLPK